MRVESQNIQKHPKKQNEKDEELGNAAVHKMMCQ